MKRILILGLVLTIFFASASAQDRGDQSRRHRIERGYNNGHLTKPEKFRLQKDRFRYKAEKRRVHRDGRVSPMERRKLSKIRKHDRREIFRLKHNRRKR